MFIVMIAECILMVVKLLSKLGGNNGRKRYRHGASWDYFMGPKARRARTFLQAQAKSHDFG